MNLFGHFTGCSRALPPTTPPATQAKPDSASFERLFLYLGRENPDDNCQGSRNMLAKHCVCSLVG